MVQMDCAEWGCGGAGGVSGAGGGQGRCLGGDAASPGREGGLRGEFVDHSPKARESVSGCARDGLADSAGERRGGGEPPAGEQDHDPGGVSAGVVGRVGWLVAGRFYGPRGTKGTGLGPRGARGWDARGTAKGRGREALGTAVPSAFAPAVGAYAYVKPRPVWYLLAIRSNDFSKGSRHKEA